MISITHKAEINLWYIKRFVCTLIHDLKSDSGICTSH